MLLDANLADQIEMQTRERLQLCRAQNHAVSELKNGFNFAGLKITQRPN
jgi:hypothetical protein